MYPRIDAALAYAAKGLKIFPCRPGTKFPVFRQPFENATTDHEIIKNWFTIYGDVNIAFCPEDNGRCVVDLDNKNGKRGQDNWCDLPGEKPATYTVVTPTGGLHFHYLGSLRPTVGKLADGIDTRGIRSLALLPPSVTKDGQYEDLIACDPVPAPAWLLEWGKPRERAKLETPDDLELDAPWMIEVAKDHLARVLAKEGPWGQDDDPDTFQIAADVKDLGISEETAVEMMMEPLAEDERDWLAVTVQNAYRYGQNPIGARAYPDPAKLMEGLPPPNPTGASTQKRRRFEARLPTEDATAPPLDYWDDHRDKRMLPKLPGGCAIIVYGESGSHKSGVILKELADAALTRGGRVLYLAAEGAHGIWTARLPELMKHRGRPLADLNDRWRTLSAGLDLLNDADLAELIHEYRDFRPNLIALDTLTRCTGGADINHPTTGTATVKAMETLAVQWDATVIGVTHPGPDGKSEIGSKQQGNQAFGRWRIEHDNGVIRVHVEKIKEGPSDFFIPLRVRSGGVPVVYEMSPEEREKLLRGGPTHDDTRDMVWRVIYPMIAGGDELSWSNRGKGAGFVRGLIRDAGGDAEEPAIKQALDDLAARGYLDKKEGGTYQLGTAAKPPETLQ